MKKAMSYYFSSVAMIAKNDLKKAESILAEATMIAAGNPDVDTRINAATGQIFLLKKDYNKAKSYAEKAIQLSNGKSTEAAELMGDIYKATEDSRNAALYYLIVHVLIQQMGSQLRFCTALHVYSDRVDMVT